MSSIGQAAHYRTLTESAAMEIIVNADEQITTQLDRNPSPYETEFSMQNSRLSLAAAQATDKTLAAVRRVVATLVTMARCAKLKRRSVDSDIERLDSLRASMNSFASSLSQEEESISQALVVATNALSMCEKGGPLHEPTLDTDKFNVDAFFPDMEKMINQFIVAVREIPTHESEVIVFLTQARNLLQGARTHTERAASRATTGGKSVKLAQAASDGESGGSDADMEAVEKKLTQAQEDYSAAVAELSKPSSSHAERHQQLEKVQRLLTTCELHEAKKRRVLARASTVSRASNEAKQSGQESAAPATPTAAADSPKREAVITAAAQAVPASRSVSPHFDYDAPINLPVEENAVASARAKAHLALLQAAIGFAQFASENANKPDAATLAGNKCEEETAGLPTVLGTVAQERLLRVVDRYGGLDQAKIKVAKLREALLEPADD